MSYIKYGLLILFFLFHITVHAIEKWETNFCSGGDEKDCGTVLVGAANVFPESILFTGDTGEYLDVFISSNYFNVIGAGSYRNNADEGNWQYFSTAELYLFNTTKRVSPVGMVFAPIDENEIENITWFMSNNLSQTQTWRGKSIFNNEGSLYLDVQVKKATTQNTCINNNCEEVSCPNGQCSTVVKDKLHFIITPKVDETKFAQLQQQYPALTKPEHAAIEIHSNTPQEAGNCNLISESIPTPRQYSNAQGFFDYSNSTNMNNMKKVCNLYYRTFIVSVDKPFEFVATVSNNIPEEYPVQYNFALNGHGRSLDKILGKEGTTYITRYVRTSTGPVANFIPISSPIKQGTEVTLDASTSNAGKDSTIKNYTWLITKPDGTSDPRSGQTSSYTFSELGDHVVKLTITNNKEQTSSKEQIITVEEKPVSNTPPTINSIECKQIENELKATCSATATDKEDNANNLPLTYKWTSNSKEYSETSIETDELPVGEHNVSLIVTDSNQASSEEKTTTVTIDPINNTTITACINEPTITNKKPDGFDVELSACETNNDWSYKWIVYHNDSVKNVYDGQKIPRNTFNNGFYIATLIVSDQNNKISDTLLFSQDGKVKSTLLVSGYTINANTITIDIDKDFNYKWADDSGSKGFSDLLQPDENGKISFSLDARDELHAITMIALSKSNEIIAANSSIVKILGDLEPIADLKPKLLPLTVEDLLANNRKEFITFELDASASYDPDNAAFKLKGENEFENITDKAASINKYEWGTSLGNVCDLTNSEKSITTCKFTAEQVKDKENIDFYLFVTDDNGKRNQNDGPGGSLQKSFNLEKPTANFAVTSIENNVTFNVDASTSKVAEGRNIIYYEWLVNEEVRLQEDSGQLGLHNGKNTITLKIVDNHGLSDVVKKVFFVGENYRLGNQAYAIDKEGNPINDLGTEFFSEISVNENISDLSDYVKISSQDFLELKAGIKVDSNHINKSANLLVVLGMEKKQPYTGGDTTSYYAYNPNNSKVFPAVDLYAKPEIWIPQLVGNPVKSDITLDGYISIDLSFLNGQPIDINSPLDSTTMYYIFIGYDLKDGVIVYPSKPIMIEVGE